MKNKLLMWILLGAILAAGSVAQGQDFGSLSLAPAAVYLTGDSQHVEGSFQITNGASDPAEIEIALMDFAIAPNGGFQTLPVGTRGVNSLAPYVTYSPSEAVLAPGETIVVQYAIDLPDDVIGPLWGTLLVAPKEGTMMGGESSSAAGSTLGVRVKFVHPFAMLVHANPAIVPQASAIQSIAELGDYQGHPVIHAQIQVGNQCDDFLRCSVAFTLLDAAEKLVDYSADPFPRAILPKETREFGTLFSAADLDPGTYSVLAEIDFGGAAILTTIRQIEIGAS